MVFPDLGDQPQARPAWTSDWANVLYTKDIGTAFREARSAAGDKHVLVHGASTAQRAIAAGILDEMEIRLIPVLLGGGRRLFDHLDPEQRELERIRVLGGEAELISGTGSGTDRVLARPPPPPPPPPGADGGRQVCRALSTMRWPSEKSEQRPSSIVSASHSGESDSTRTTPKISVPPQPLPPPLPRIIPPSLP